MSEKKNIRFKKMSGAGNDFILIDNLAGNYTIDWPQIVPKICDRRNGIGADGLLIIGKSAKADFTMLYYNSDGSSGGMCGNGGRCAARFFSNLSANQEISFEALNYIYHAKIIDNINIALKTKEPNHLELNKLIDISEATLAYHYLDSGSPHVVIFIIELP
jgi:diaminopimelate epimerase